MVKRLFEMVSEGASMSGSKIVKASPYQRKVKKGATSSSKSFKAKVKQVLQNVAEAKEVQVFNALATAPLNAGQSNLYLINGVATGTDYNTRIGREIKHKYIEVDIGIISKVVAAAAGTEYYGDWGFWAVVLDRQPGGALPVFGDVFDIATANGGVAFRITSSNQDRFKILCREEYAVATSAIVGITPGSTGSQPYHMKKYIDLSHLDGHDQSANFLSTASTIAAFDNGSIYFVIASATSSANNNTFYQVNTKYRFTDV